MSAPKTLTITLDAFLQRIAWFVVEDNPDAAEALRRLAADLTPPYRVDENIVATKVAELRRRRELPPRLD